MIKVLFFAQTRELLGRDDISVVACFYHVEELRALLAAQNERWAFCLQKDKLLVAVNQTLVSLDSPLSDADEVAFFPPVTGG